MAIDPDAATLQQGVAADRAAALADRRPNGLLRFFRRLFREKPLGAFSFVVLVLLVTLVFVGPRVAQYDPASPDFVRLQSPGGENVLGTDGFGRDIFTRILYGARTTMLVATGAMIIQLLTSVTIGTTSGYFGGIYSTFVQRIVDAIQSFPALVLLIVVGSVIGSGLWQMIVMLGFLGSAGASRVVRSAVLGVLAEPYIESAKAVGAGPLRIILRYVLPNISAPLIVTSTTALGGFMLAEASLSFLGLGIQNPGQPSWGSMLNNARPHVTTTPLQAFWPGLAISLAVFSSNMLGDSLRDLLDPRLRGVGKRRM
jgi:peptide/nickel transport system permease protein